MFLVKVLVVPKLNVFRRLGSGSQRSTARFVTIMACLKESWLQEVLESLKLPAFSPALCKALLPVIEMHLKKLVEQAHKFQRRSKAQKLSVQDINLALSMNKIEPIYGLNMADHYINSNASQSSSKLLDQMNDKILLVDLVKVGLPPCPIKPQVSLHWLAVHGSQPLIAENPSIVAAEVEEQPHALPKEMQHLYARVTGIILSASDGGSSDALKAVLAVFQNDAGIQELMPYLSRFFYQQIKNNTKRLPLLYAIIRSIKALLKNPSINLEYHLQQLLPVIFTCVVSPKLSTTATEDHWSLRLLAADIVADICSKYSDQFSDLQPRVYKTYIEALGDDKSLVTVYGGIIGLTALGYAVVKSILVQEYLPQIHNRLVRFNETNYGSNSSSSSSNNKSVAIKTEPAADQHVDKKVKLQSTKDQLNAEKQKAHDFNVDMCRMALLKALGWFVVTSIRLPRIATSVSRSASNSNVSSSGNHNASGRLAARNNLPLCDLEEALVPHYVSASSQNYYCRLMI